MSSLGVLANGTVAMSLAPLQALPAVNTCIGIRKLIPSRKSSDEPVHHVSACISLSTMGVELQMSGTDHVVFIAA